MSYKKFSCTFLGILLLVATHTVGQTIPTPFDSDRIRRATVFIMQTQLIANRPVITCVSSGTIVSRDGLILTNAHSTLTSLDCPGNNLIVALSLRADEPPIATYQADIVQANNGLDLALLRITRELDGRLINTSELALPFVDLADSSSVQLDETLWVVGYPGISNDPVVEVRTNVLGFTAEPTGGDRTWFKIAVTPDAILGDIPGVMSGGGAYNRNGQLVGIPSTAPITRQAAVSECQLIQDTNNDGLVNQNDICIALGGSINVLRPSNFARPLLRSASLGLQVAFLSENPAQVPLLGQPEIGRTFFASSVNNNLPSSVIGSLPAGSDSLYFFFDYANMTPETVYELRVSIRGIPNPVFSLTPVRWSGGTRGLWYVGSVGQPLPNGDYEFALFVNGLLAAPPRQITVGGSAEARPTFRSPFFAIVDGNQVFGDGYVLGTGNIVQARFVHNNMTNGLSWAYIWYYNGAEIPRSRQSGVWSTADDQDTSSRTIALESINGLPPGRYRLELYIEDQLASLGDFTIAGAREAAFPRVFSETHFAIADTPQEAITARPVSSFASRVDRLYALFDWEQLAPGTMWRLRWSVDNIPFYDQLLPWTNAASGENYLMELTGPGSVPEGTYRVDLMIDNIVLQSQTIEIGIGQLPLDPFTRAEGVQLIGQVIDADTREGIPNLTVIIISDQFSVEDYEARSDQVFALAVTDRNGRFQVDRPLQFDAPYSFLIAADGYLPMPADGIVVDEDSPNPLEMIIYLTRD